MSVRWQQIRAFAASTRARYDTELGGDASFPLDVDDLAERVYQLTAFADPTLDPRINGELNPVLQSIRLKTGLHPTRARFIVAHELGHYVVEGASALMQDNDATIDERAGGDGETDGGVLRVYNTRERAEQEANLFALELLIPAEMLWQLVQQPGWTVAGLAGVFGVSTDALRTQLLNVCCLEPVVDRRAAQTNAVSFAPDPEQQAAVHAPLPTLVVAGPGTGKTRSIVAKYVALVEGGADPASILALTFSNKAAEEMRGRIIRTLSRSRPDLAGRVEVSTFHAWGLNFLKSYGTHVGLPLDLQLRATGDLFVLLKHRLADLLLEHYKMLHDPAFYLNDIMRAISRAKDELRSPAEYRALAEAEAERLITATEIEAAGKTTQKAIESLEKAQCNAARLRELAVIYERYDALLREEGVVDYGDLIMRAVEALRIPDVARELHETYQYILVDEFQDINYASGQLVALLDGGRGCVWAVGDPWQSIYRFRGASAANLAAFSSAYPNATTVSLIRNYRSAQGILDASHAIMAADPLAANRAGQQAQRRSRRGLRVVEWAAENQTAEYAAIAHDILRRVGGPSLRTARCAWQHNGRIRRVRAVDRQQARRARFGDHAVLCRKHAQVAAIVETLEAHGIPVDGGGALLDYAEVKDVLAICALARSINSVGLLRALTLPEYKLSSDDLELLVRNADAERRSLQRATRDATIVADLSPEGQATLERLSDLRDRLDAESDAWRVITRYVFDYSATMREQISRAAAGDAVARRELANLGQLTLLARNFVHQAPPAERDARSFIAYVRLLIEAGEAPKAAPLADGADAVRVMTIHAAKGLEFRTVYVPGVQHGVFPPKKQGSVVPEIGGLVHGPLGDELQEERYLLYVAMTRAQHRLVLSRSTRKSDKPITRSSLLPQDACWPIHHRCVERACRSVDRETRLNHTPIEQPIVAATSLETYETCPRRYLYQYGYQLYDDVAPFLRMHQTIHDVIDHLTDLTEQGQTGELPRDEDDLRRLVWQVFARHELPDALYSDDYFTEAFRHVCHIWRELRNDPLVAQSVNQRVIVQRPAGPVSVRIDRVEQTANGLRYVQLKSGRVRKDDHLDMRVMLYALAAQEHAPNAELAIRYTATGETRTVTHRKDTVKNHTTKIDALLGAIAAGRWEPNYGEQCASCPFNLICPI